MKKSSSAALSLLLITAIILVNILAGNAGPFMDIDLSNKDIYGISSASRVFLAKLDTPIEMIILSDEPDARIVKYVSKYCAPSNMLTWRRASPVQEPELLNQFDTSPDVVIVRSVDSGRYKCVPFSDIAEYDLMRYAYYGEYKETAFDADSELTNAASFVASEKTFVACFTQGHGEAESASVLLREMAKARFEVVRCDLMREGGVPERCDIIIINSPQTDLSPDEADMLRGFISGGGNVVLLLSSDFTGDYSVFAELTAGAGIDIGEGIVKDPGSCYQNEFLIFPQLGSSDDITRYLGSDAKCLLYRARPLSLSGEKVEGRTVHELLATSSEGVASDIFGNVSKEGSIVLAASAVWKEGGAFAVLPASLISETTLNNYGNLANREIFINAIMQDLDEATAYVIPSVPLGNSLNAVTSGGVYRIAIVAVLPALLLVFGALRCMMRRRG